MNWVESDPKAYPLFISIPADVPLIGLPFAGPSPVASGPFTPLHIPAAWRPTVALRDVSDLTSNNTEKN